MSIDQYRTLLLDASYRPIRVIPWLRAVNMDLSGKVYVVSAYGRKIQTPSQELVLPAVCALRNFYPFRPFKPTFSKRNVFHRDGFTCAYCGKRFPRDSLTLDHVLPRAQGGKSSWENLVTACGPCNLKKGDRTPEQAGMPLLFGKPKMPNNMLVQISTSDIPPEWESFLTGTV